MKYLYILRKKYLTCIPRKYKPFEQLTQLDDFTTSTVVNLFVREKLKIPEAYSEPSGITKMGFL